MSDLFDPQFFRMRELALAIAVTASHDRRPENLFDLPTIDPPPIELRVVREAHARALACGLVLPPYPRTTACWVRSQDTTLAAQTWRRRDAVIEMLFVVGHPLDQLRKTALHELRHVHQFATDMRLPYAELEADAETFAWNALQGWDV